MALDVSTLRESFTLALTRNPELTGRFYEILFERYPHLAPMFDANARSHQPAKLAAALRAVVNNLEDPQWLQRTLGAMGERHVGYGVTRDMYAPVGDALLSSMREAVGDDWTDVHEAQWTEAYGVVVDLMCPVPAAKAG